MYTSAREKQTKNTCEKVLADQDFSLVSSLCSGLFFDDIRYRDDHLIYHRDRLLAAARAFNWPRAVDTLSGAPGLQAVRDAITTRDSGNTSLQQRSATDIEKIRLLVDRTGMLRAESSVIGSDTSLVHPKTSFVPAQLSMNIIADELCQVYADTTHTTPTLFTTHKTSIRRLYDEARARAGISKLGPTQAEVLMYNTEYEIMEASLSTTYFFRGGRWVTPALKSGGNAGVSRHLALEKGLCVEDVVTVDELIDGEIVFVSNGVRGFVQGVLRLHLKA